MADESLTDASVLITGASAGIGREAAHLFADEGAAVALAARRRAKLQNVADEIEAETDAETLVIPTDVADEDQVERLVEETVDTFGGLDVLVNNAAIGQAIGASVEEMPSDEFHDVMDVNTDGMFFTTRAAIPHLRESKGNLIFVASFAGEYPRPNNVVYAATKWWTRGFAHSLEGDIGEDDVGVTVINPSGVRTEFGKEYRERVNKDRLPEGEVLEPEDVAEAIVFAARQDPPVTVSELDLYNRDKFASF